MNCIINFDYQISLEYPRSLPFIWVGRVGYCYGLLNRLYLKERSSNRSLNLVLRMIIFNKNRDQDTVL